MIKEKNPGCQPVVTVPVQKTRKPPLPETEFFLERSHLWKKDIHPFQGRKQAPDALVALVVAYAVAGDRCAALGAGVRMQHSRLLRSQRFVNSTYLALEYPRVMTKAGTLWNSPSVPKYWQIPQSIWACLPGSVSYCGTAGMAFGGRKTWT